MFLAVGVQRATPQRVVTFESKHSLGNVGLGDDDAAGRADELYELRVEVGLVCRQ